MTDEARKLADVAAKLDEYSRTHGLISSDFDREQFAKMAAALRSQPGPLAREEVARIIDPIAFAKHAEGDYLNADLHYAREQAWKSADAILALTPSHEAGTQEPVATKKTYLKPFRTIVELDARYADQIRDLLNAAPQPASVAQYAPTRAQDRK